MKDSEFIELLNLYLDHEISAADAVRLEAEVQSNPARRRVYHDYCRMQKACKMLTQDFQTETAGAAEKKVVPFDPSATAGRRASRANAFYTIGAVAAAAACVAIIFVGRSRQQPSAPGAQSGAAIVAKSEPAVAPQSVAATETKTTPMAIDTPQAQARAGGALAANPLRHNPDAVQASFVGANALFLSQNNAPAQAQPANDQFAWLQGNLGLVSLEQQLQLEQMRFQTPSMTLQPSGVPLGGKNGTNKPQQPASEMATFQFTLGR